VKNYEPPQDSRNGFTAGITYEHIFKNRLSVSIDLLYSQRGSCNDFRFVLPNDILTEPALGVLTPYTYIALPVRLGVNFGKQLYGFANAGLVPSLLARAEAPYMAYNENGALLEKGTIDFTHKLNRLDLAGIAEVGGGYKFDRRSRIFGAFSYQQSFTNTNNTQSFSGSSLKYNGLTLAVGIKWELNRSVPAGETAEIKME
jgi:hypothetical protein